MSKNRHTALLPVLNEMCKVVNSGDQVIVYGPLYGEMEITGKVYIENSIYIYMKCNYFHAN